MSRRRRLLAAVTLAVATLGLSSCDFSVGGDPAPRTFLDVQLTVFLRADGTADVTVFTRPPFNGFDESAFTTEIADALELGTPAPAATPVEVAGGVGGFRTHVVGGSGSVEAFDVAWVGAVLRKYTYAPAATVYISACTLVADGVASGHNVTVSQRDSCAVWTGVVSGASDASLQVTFRQRDVPSPAGTYIGIGAGLVGAGLAIWRMRRRPRRERLISIVAIAVAMGVAGIVALQSGGRALNYTYHVDAADQLLDPGVREALGNQALTALIAGVAAPAVLLIVSEVLTRKRYWRDYPGRVRQESLR